MGYLYGPFKIPLMKPWGVTEQGLEYKGKIVPFSQIDSVSILQAPVALSKDGKALVRWNGQPAVVISFAYKDRQFGMPAIRYIEDKMNEAKGVKKEYKNRFLSYTGSTLEVYDDYLVLTHVSWGGGTLTALQNLAYGGDNGGKRINYSDITAIQFKQPNGSADGYIQFAYPGSSENKVGMSGAFTDENTIMVSPWNFEEAKTIVQFIEERRKNSKNSSNVVVNNVSAAEELKKFKELLDMGIITQEEFDAKKKQILGL